MLLQLVRSDHLGCVDHGRRIHAVAEVGGATPVRHGQVLLQRMRLQRSGSQLAICSALTISRPAIRTNCRTEPAAAGGSVLDSAGVRGASSAGRCVRAAPTHASGPDRAARGVLLGLCQQSQDLVLCPPPEGATQMRPLRIGVQLPEVERLVRWPEYAAMARAAEEVGFDSVWVGDHLLYRGDRRPERGPWDADVVGGTRWGD